MSYRRYEDWLEEALDDLETASELLKIGKWSKVCYFSHQAAEKALKAFIIKKLGIYKHTHSTAELAGEVSQQAEFPQDLLVEAGKLDRHYIPTRYPNAWPALPPYKHYNKTDAEEALETSKKVVNYVRNRIGGDP